MWPNKLNIGDANILISRGEDKELGSKYKELIVSYKTIFINTYNIIVQEISSDPDQQYQEDAVLFKFEGFQLWEARISGVMT